MLLSPSPRRFSLPALCNLSLYDSRHVAHGVADLRVSPSAPQPKTAPYRISYSSATSYVGSDHIYPTAPQLIADLPSGLTIKVPIYLAALANVDRCAVCVICS